MSPISWYWGNQDILIVEVLALNSFIMSIKLWARLLCDIITPLGSDVDPEVYWRKAMESLLGLV